MKAVQLDHYNKHLAVHVREIDQPTITADQVLVKVKTAAVNPVDVLNITGDVKLIQPLPRPATLGNELAGVIAQVGANVTDW